MRPKTSPERRMGAASDFIDSQAATGHVAFPMSRLIKETGLSVVAAKRQLSRLGQRVVRPMPKRQFFLIVSPEHRTAGAPPVAWWIDDYFKWLKRPYYIALQSAAALHGANPQAIQVTQVMTDRPRRTLSIGRIQIQFFVKRRFTNAVTQPLSNAHAPALVSTPEATVFDLIRYAQRIGGIGRALETLAPLLPQLKARELKRVLDTEKETTTAQRLGYLLERKEKQNLAAIIHKWIPSPTPLIPLVAAAKTTKNTPVIEKWRLLDNAAASEL